jgi:hypothetical protein
VPTALLQSIGAMGNPLLRQKRCCTTPAMIADDISARA